jgi:hypothetical protein
VLREREEGRRREPVAPVAEGVPAPSPNIPPPTSVDSGGEDDLYDRYVAAKRELGQEIGVDRVGFQRQLETQREQVEARLGEGVRFEVVVDGGKVKLAARRSAAGRDRE